MIDITRADRRKKGRRREEDDRLWIVMVKPDFLFLFFFFFNSEDEEEKEDETTERKGKTRRRKGGERNPPPLSIRILDIFVSHFTLCSHWHDIACLNFTVLLSINFLDILLTWFFCRSYEIFHTNVELI